MSKEEADASVMRTSDLPSDRVSRQHPPMARVGAEVFLTAKAVDYHLSNIFAKLGLNSRRELRRLRTAS